MKTNILVILIISSKLLVGMENSKKETFIDFSIPHHAVKIQEARWTLGKKLDVIDKQIRVHSKTEDQAIKAQLVHHRKKIETWCEKLDDCIAKIVFHESTLAMRIHDALKILGTAQESSQAIDMLTDKTSQESKSPQELRAKL